MQNFDYYMLETEALLWTFGEHYKYTKDHAWVSEQDDGTLIIGITNYAQASLGNLVFVELPEIDDMVVMGDECAVVESVKAASDVYCPLSGTITKKNLAASYLKPKKDDFSLISHLKHFFHNPWPL